MLQGKEMEPQENEDHATHIQVHQELLDDEGVDKELQENVVMPHIMVHEHFMDMAKKQIEADLNSMPDRLSNINQGDLNVQNQATEQLPQIPAPQSQGQEGMAGAQTVPAIPGQ